MASEFKPTPAKADTERGVDAASGVGAGEPVEIDAIRRRLIGLAVKLVWNRDDAEEIVQEGWRIALERGVGPGEARFGPWMHRTVSNLCLSHRRKRRMAALPDDLGGGAESGGRAERGERLERLRLALERLPEQQRLAIVLRTMESMDYEAIAGIMELSEEAVRTHVHLARRRLAELMRT